jgi:hypothetical protein
MNTDEPGTPPKTRWTREIPAPWIDCESCSWRHYPDTSRRRGPQFPEACARCGTTLTRPGDPEVAT